MTTVSLTLDEIAALTTRALARNGCDHANTQALVRTVVAAERDGSHSHGLFRVPGYIASLRSGKVDGNASPEIRLTTPAIIAVDGRNGFAPLALERGIGALADAARCLGVAVMRLVRSYHFAALWPEVEQLTERGLAGLACVNYLPAVAPYGGREPIFGTNPIAFAWPRPGKPPVVVDMATSAMAQGEIQIAARERRFVPLGTGLDCDGRPSTDPSEILRGGVASVWRS